MKKSNDLEVLFGITGKPFKSPKPLFKQIETTKREELISRMIEFLSWYGIYDYRCRRALDNLRSAYLNHTLPNRKISDAWWQAMTKEVSLVFLNDSGFQAIIHRVFIMIKAMDDRKSSYMQNLTMQRDLNTQNYHLMKTTISANNEANKSSKFAIVMPDLFCLIVSYLNSSDLFNLGQTCQLLLALIRDDKVWQKICQLKIAKGDNPTLSKEIQCGIEKRGHTGYSFWRIYKSSCVEINCAKTEEMLSDSLPNKDGPSPPK